MSQSAHCAIGRGSRRHSAEKRQITAGRFIAEISRRLDRRAVTACYKICYEVMRDLSAAFGTSIANRLVNITTITTRSA